MNAAISNISTMFLGSPKEGWTKENPLWTMKGFTPFSFLGSFLKNIKYY